MYGELLESHVSNWLGVEDFEGTYQVISTRNKILDLLAKPFQTLTIVADIDSLSVTPFLNSTLSIMVGDSSCFGIIDFNVYHQRDSEKSCFSFYHEAENEPRVNSLENGIVLDIKTQTESEQTH